MNAPSSIPITVDIVSDVVCPWCFIGKRRLEKAMAAFEAPLAIRWRPYQLDPTIPAGGKDRRAYLEAKFGSAERIRQLHENVSVAGASEGIDFAFDKILVSPNTLDAHRLIRWAGQAGVEGKIVEALFRAYFFEGKNIGDHAVLVEIAARHGMDGALIPARLSGDEDRDDVTEEIDSARRIGVTGVPTFIVGNRYAVVGAQPAEEIVRALEAVQGEATPAPARV